MSVSESSSATPFPQYRVKRKAPPIIDTSEKYPSPDPQNPFAPLWELRNRTSSALGQNPLASKDNPSPYSQPPSHTHQGHHNGKSENYKTPTALNFNRKRSNSYLSSHPTTTYGIPRSSSTAPRNAPGLARLPSHSASIKTGGGVSNSQLKPANLQIDSEMTNTMARIEKQRNDPQLVHPQPRAPGHVTRRLTVDKRTPDNSSGNETESDLSVPKPAHRRQSVDVKVKSIESQKKSSNPGLTTAINFNVGVDFKPVLLQRVASNGTTSTGSGSLARNIPTQQSLLAKFWLPKKTSHDGYIADGEKRNAKANLRSHHKGPFSISAPLTNTFTHEGRSKSQQSKYDDNTSSLAPNSSRSQGGYTSDTDFEGSRGGIRLKGVLFRVRKKAGTEDTPVNATPEGTGVVINLKPVVEAEKAERPGDKETEKRRPEMSWAEVNKEDSTPHINPRGSYPTPAPSPQLKPVLELKPEGPLEEEKVKSNELKEERNDRAKPKSHNGSKDSTMGAKEQQETAGSHAPRVKKLKDTRTTTTTTTNGSTSVPPSSSTNNTSISPPPLPPPKMFKRRTSSSTPGQFVDKDMPSASSQNDPVQIPSTISVSTSIVHVSLISGPKSSEPPLNEGDVGAFVKPRRAPRPPEGVQSEPEPLIKEGNQLLKGSKEGRKLSRKDKREGGDVVSSSKSKPLSDDDVQATKPQNLDAEVRGMKAPDVDIKLSSRPHNSAMKHGKAASSDFGSRRDKFVAVSRTEGLDGGFSKAKVPVSVSTPVCLSSKEHEGGCLPQSRPIFHPRGATPDNSFIGVPSTEYSLPTRTQLTHAAALPVFAEDGHRHLFGNLFKKQKTVVIFIRHFWCPLCQDYMSVVKSTVTPDMVVADDWINAGGEKDDDEVVWKRRGESSTPEADKIGFVVISNGAHGMIAKYRQIFSLPFRVFTDPSLAIYKLLGMGKTGTDCQEPQHSHANQYLSDSSAPSMPKSRKHNYSLRKKADTSASSLSDKESGGYIKHGFMGGIAMVFARAIKVGMPVWEKGGDLGQLGGEFVLGPGMICTYAHKMQSPKGHAPIEEVLQAAEVKIPKLVSPLSPDPAQKQPNYIDLSSPPKPARRPQEPERNRKESFKGVQASSTSSGAIGTNATTISRPHPRDPTRRSSRERSNDPSIPTSVSGHKIPPILPPALKAVMTREEETRWEEDRQRAIERAIQDKGHNVRKIGALGALGRSEGTSVRQPGTSKEGRGNAMLTKSGNAPTRSFEEEERIVYKAEDRRVQERMRVHDVPHDSNSGSGNAPRVSTSRVSHSRR